MVFTDVYTVLFHRGNSKLASWCGFPLYWRPWGFPFWSGGKWMIFYGIWFLSCVITCSDFHPLSNQINLYMRYNNVYCRILERRFGIHQMYPFFSNNSYMGAPIVLKISWWVDLEVLITFSSSQFFFYICNGFWVISQKMSFYHVLFLVPVAMFFDESKPLIKFLN